MKDFRKPNLSYSLRVKLADLVNLRPSQLVLWIALTISVIGIVSVFLHAIPVVIRSGTKPQMVWAHAKRFVASVKNPKAIRNWPVVDYPGNAMSVLASSLGAASPNRSVALGRIAEPKPAALVVRQDKDFVPKAFDDGGRKPLLREILRSYRNHVVSFSSACLTGAAELLFCNKSPMTLQHGCGC